ncbi:MAG: 4Fe-4S dicluster domain-containing protein, partial [Chloroflexi bacterium]|nr:4Fe-4S dicluster domain-containing protein [Chloroflexota bacterium]
MYIVSVNHDLCTGCGECVSTCPVSFFELQEINGKTVSVPIGEPDDCLGCESCVAVCPE